MLKKELDSINKKIDKILKNENSFSERLKNIEKKEEIIDVEEKADLKSEKSFSNIETGEVDELKKLENLEKEVESSVVPHPLTKVTYRDAVKGTIGAFFGIVGHFSFLDGLDQSRKISMIQATSIFIAAFGIGLLFIYYSGFRKVKEVRVLSFIPLRVTLMFFVTITVVIGVYLLFGVINLHTSFAEAYKMISVSSIIGMLGAGTADLIGGH